MAYKYTAFRQFRISFKQKKQQLRERKERKRRMMTRKKSQKRKREKKETPKLDGYESEDFASMTKAEQKRCLDRKRRLLGPPPLVITEQVKESYRLQNVKLATLALADFNSSEPNKSVYELVRTKDSEAFGFGHGFVFHTNFEARISDDPDAPVELFFGELALSNCRWTVNRCAKLGLAESEDDIVVFRGCNCEDNIKHPPDGKFTVGI